MLTSSREENKSDFLAVYGRLKLHLRMKTLLKTIITAAVLGMACGASAQVYQWKDPESGVTRFSNTAPSWFRLASSGVRAPRTQAYYYGYLIDDTALSYEERLALRAQSIYSRVLPSLLPPSSQQTRR